MLQGSFAEGCGKVRSLQEMGWICSFHKSLGASAKVLRPFWGSSGPERINEWPLSRIKWLFHFHSRPRLRARRGVSQVNSTLPTRPPETSLPGGVDVAALALGSQRPLGLRTLPPHHRPGTPTHHNGDLYGSAGLEQGRGRPRRSPTDRLLRSPGEK